LLREGDLRDRKVMCYLVYEHILSVLNSVIIFLCWYILCCIIYYYENSGLYHCFFCQLYYRID